VVLGRLMKLAAPDKGVLAVAFALLLCASLAELGIPWLVCEPCYTQRRKKVANRRR
jgi:hypothetical protein